MCCECRIAIKALQGLTLASADRKRARPSAPLSPHTHVHTHIHTTTITAHPVCHKFQSEATPSVMHFPAAARAVRRYHNTGKDKKKVRHVLCVFRSCCNTAGHLSHLHLSHGCDGKDNSGAPVWVFFFCFLLKFMQILSDWRKASYIITT